MKSRLENVIIVLDKYESGKKVTIKELILAIKELDSTYLIIDKIIDKEDIE